MPQDENGIAALQAMRLQAQDPAEFRGIPCKARLQGVPRLIRIVEVHSKTDCKITADIGCPVLMCDTFRMVAKKNKIAKMNSNYNANQPKKPSKADS